MRDKLFKHINVIENREFCQIKLANAQVKIQEPVTRDSEDLQHLSPESITKISVGFAQAILLRHINKVFYSILFHSIPFYSILFYSTKFRSRGIQITFFVVIQSIRVQIKEEQILESSPLQSGALNFQSIPITASGGTPLPSHHFPPLRITNKDVMFGATLIGTVKSMSSVIIFVFVYSFI